MPPAGGQMCGRMTCWPDGLPAVNQEAPFPLTSFFPTEPMPAPTSRLRAENHIRRKESSGGKCQHMNTIHYSNADLIHNLFSLKVSAAMSTTNTKQIEVNHTGQIFSWSLIFPCHHTRFLSHPQAIPEQVEGKRLHFKTPKTVTWAPENNGEKLKPEEEKVSQDMLEQRRLQKLEKAGIKVLPAAVRYSRSERKGMRAAAAVVEQFWSCSLTNSCDG